MISSNSSPLYNATVIGVHDIIEVAATSFYDQVTKVMPVSYEGGPQSNKSSVSGGVIGELVLKLDTAEVNFYKDIYQEINALIIGVINMNKKSRPNAIMIYIRKVNN